MSFVPQMAVHPGRRPKWAPPLRLRARQRAAILRPCFPPTGGTWGGAILVPDPAGLSTTRTRKGPAQTRGTFTTRVRPTMVLPGVWTQDSIRTAEAGRSGNHRYRYLQEAMCSSVGMTPAIRLATITNAGEDYPTTTA